VRHKVASAKKIAAMSATKRVAGSVTRRVEASTKGAAGSAKRSQFTT
jgi:hypothetical protein